MTVYNNTNQQHNKQLLIITGLSGAGKTTVMRALEDIGFYCVDNLPLPLCSTFLSFLSQQSDAPLRVALGIDARSEQFLNNFVADIEHLKTMQREYTLTIVFVNAQTQTLFRRFQETRRKHPLADSISMQQAIEREKMLLQPIKEIASVVLETDSLSIHELRRWITNSFCPQGEKVLVVNLISFGFKYGVPTESNMIFDVRFLPNPYFIASLKELDGTSKVIQNFLFEHDTTIAYWNNLKSFLYYSLEQFYQEGRFLVTVSIGCTGGKHRSVAFVEQLSQQALKNISFVTTHRDLGKE